MGRQAKIFFLIMDVFECRFCNRSDVLGELDILNPENLPMQEMIATYDKEDIWTLTGNDLPTAIRGARQIKGPGFILTISSEASTGDTLIISPQAGAAANMRFLLEKPQQLALLLDC